MSKVIAWVKANVWIVVLSALILIVLPTGWVVSSMWNKSIRTARQKEVDDNRTKLRGVTEIAYALKAVVPGTEPVEYKAAPNEKTIELFSRRLAEQDEQVASVVKMAQEMNGRGHEPLIDGLFPAPSPSNRQAKVLEFMGMLVPTGDRSNPSAYERLLASIGAGGPPNPQVVMQSLDDAKQREQERHKAGSNTTDLNEVEQKELEAALVNQRLALYKAQAEQVSVYATMDIFPKLANDAWPQVPDSMLRQPPRVDTCFNWQCDYWTVQDVLGAVKLANSDRSGRATMVPDSVVKRIESIRLDMPPWLVMSSGRDEDGGGPPPAVDPKSALIQPAYNLSLTGRIGGKSSQMYDVRKVKMTAVVSMERMPEFFNAIARANFMTVVGLNLRPVNINYELEQGYFYGREAVVRADMEIEVVWLRTWTTPYMPATVRASLGLPVAEGEAESAEEPAPGPGRGGGR